MMVPLNKEWPGKKCLVADRNDEPNWRRRCRRVTYNG